MAWLIHAVPLAAQDESALTDALASLADGQAAAALRKDPDATRRAVAVLFGIGDTAPLAALLDAGMDPGGTLGSGQTLLAEAVRAGDPAAVRLLLAAGADPLDGGSGPTPLEIAAALEDAELTGLLATAAGASPELVDFAAMIRAMATGDVAAVAETARSIAAAGRRLTHAEPDGSTILHVAIEAGSPDIVQAVLEGKPPLEAVDGGLSPLSFAISLDRPDIARTLIAAGADPNETVEGTTLLHLAVAASPGSVDVLVAANARRRATDAEGATPADLALFLGLDELAAKIDPVSTANKALVSAMRERNEMRVRAAIDAGAEPDDLRIGDDTLFAYAGRQGFSRQMTRMLVDASRTRAAMAPEVIRQAVGRGDANGFMSILGAFDGLPGQERRRVAAMQVGKGITLAAWIASLDRKEAGITPQDYAVLVGRVAYTNALKPDGGPSAFEAAVAAGNAEWFRIANPSPAEIARYRPTLQMRARAAGDYALLAAMPYDLTLPGAALQPFTSESSARTLQQRLNTLGFDAGTVDGKPGPRTRVALAEFFTQVRRDIRSFSRLPAESAQQKILQWNKPGYRAHRLKLPPGSPSLILFDLDRSWKLGYAGERFEMVAEQGALYFERRSGARTVRLWTGGPDNKQTGKVWEVAKPSGWN